VDIARNKTQKDPQIMRKLSIFFSFALLSASAAWGDVQYIFTMNTTSIDGTSGSIDFALYPGAGSDQSLTATVMSFLPTTSPYTGVQTPTGGVSGGPVVGGDTLTLTASSADNDDLETFTYGDSLTFKVDIAGPALTAPNGDATSPYQFIFSTYSDAAGTIPVLTTDPGGAAGIINISDQGVVTTDAVSPEMKIVATPEPSSLWMLAGVLALLGGAQYSRRRAVR
jgi:hypothetical protein